MKLAESPDLSAFLAESLAAVIAVPIDTDGTVHAAGLLYLTDTNPLRLYFVTSRQTEKYTLLKQQSQVPCAVVIGTEKGTPFTVQMHGFLQEVNSQDFAEVLQKYYQKVGNRHDDIDNPQNCLLEFTPNWARFTDYSQGFQKYPLDLS